MMPRRDIGVILNLKSEFRIWKSRDVTSTTPPYKTHVFRIMKSQCNPESKTEFSILKYVIPSLTWSIPVWLRCDCLIHHSHPHNLCLNSTIYLMLCPIQRLRMQRPHRKKTRNWIWWTVDVSTVPSDSRKNITNRSSQNCKNIQQYRCIRSA